MTNRGAATRYARALFDTTLAEGLDLLQTQKDLGEFARLVAGNDALQRVLTNPAIPVARKRGVIEQLIRPSRAPARFSRRVAKLLLMLAERDRLVILPDARARVRRPAHGTSERGAGQDRDRCRLPPDRVTALAAGLTRATGRNVRDRNAGGPGDHRRRRGAHRRHGLRRQHHPAARADTRNARRRDRLGPKRAVRTLPRSRARSDRRRAFDA